MNYRTTYQLWLIGLICLGCASFTARSSGQDSEAIVTARESIAGMVVDQDGHPVPQSIIVAFDQETGLPLASSTGRTVTMRELNDSKDFDCIMFAQSGNDGNFEIKVAPGAGPYRLVAQSWTDQPEIANVMAVNGKTIRLDGVLENVESVATEEIPQVLIKPVGTASVAIDLEIGNSDTLLMISTHPLAGDPILGFAVWSGGFWQGVIAGNRMPKGDTTISGLPAGKIQFAAFANDNIPGFGGVLIELGEGEQRDLDIPLIASWSDGHKDPPERLENLVDYFTEHPEELQRVEAYAMSKIADPNEDRPDISQYWIRMVPLIDEDFELADGRQIKLGDAMAACGYVRLAKTKK